MKIAARPAVVMDSERALESGNKIANRIPTKRSMKAIPKVRVYHTIAH